ncbi:MAG: STAS domain-containing protein [Phycisphaerales bacterium]|nr:STAS domain-containing protein [Phycisphaerales bacterium]
MSVESWSDRVLLAELENDPGFSDDAAALIEQCEANAEFSALLNFAEVTFLNSSNISALLKLRKIIKSKNDRRLLLCGLSRQVWGVFLVTGLDHMFEVAEDVPSGLAMMQMS